MERVFEVTAGNEVVINQEYTGDVNSVVWDSCIAAIHSFIQQGHTKWKSKKVLELGAGTGAAGLICAALGADVVLTDLPEYIPLLERNLSINSHLKNNVSVSALDWLSFSSSPVLSSKYDVILMIDCIYYSSVIPGLLELLKAIECQEIICIFEKRDIGEPVAAQELFLKLVHEEFEVFSIDKSELHGEYIYTMDHQKSRDPATFSNYEQVTVTHIHIEWDVDFDAKRLTGQATLECSVLQATDKIILDGRDLEIESISHNGHELKFNSESDDVFGSRITVVTGSLQPGQTLSILIKYRTAPEARALQFLTKEQTTDKLAPYLFSQCQAIHARSIVPCMDTPSVKATYSAKVSVPSELTCLMSAIGEDPVVSGNKTVWTYKQNVAVPSYLIAIVVGKLEKREISKRCAVWAEPSIVDAALWEFEKTEDILASAEDIVGKYIWGRYDMVCLPNSFPFGGMENPCLTFLTPTLIAGDRSMVNVIAHEIAHSWTGNLVTNANWEHFWLNEGFTVFLERKIHGRMHGELERQFESEAGWDDALVPTIQKVFSPNHEFTKLIQNHQGIDPDDAFSSIPYEKGSALLFTVEQTLGDKNKFEEFLKAYIAKYSHKTVMTDDWKKMLFEYFADLKEKIDWDKWLHQPGLPPRPAYDSTLMSDCRVLAEKWLSEKLPADDTDYAKMSPTQKVAVLGCIRNKGNFTEQKMPVITSLYKLDQTKNCEIQFNWLMLGLETRWQPIVTPAMNFVTRVGRLKYCKPIYKALFEWSVTSANAVAQFKRLSPYMHPITVQVLSKLIPNRRQSLLPITASPFVPGYFSYLEPSQADVFHRWEESGNSAGSAICPTVRVTTSRLTSLFSLFTKSSYCLEMCRCHQRPRHDPCSASNYKHIQVSHIAIKWDVVFQLKMLMGSATLTCKMINKTDKIVLDVRDLSIRSVAVNGQDMEFRIAPNVYTFFGSKMTIYLPADLQNVGQDLMVTVNYGTSPEATALQWMKKDQTVDKKAPYLFSQCQAIHARSIVPCMDTPSVKTTYEAEVRVPVGLTCLMSAIGEGSKSDDDFTTFFYKQPVAVPSYLIAIVAGLLEKRDISDRCAVWSEPSMVDKALWEFSETEDILASAEDIVGKYIWGRYDMVCLPNSFPFGGMENPCLTFLTPTLIAGDRSLVSVIAHEIAHSWSGNLVTNSSWEHFWLNEGFTMFIERKICGRLVSEEYRQFMSFNGWTNNLIPAVHEQFTPTHIFTKLIQDHTNVDPDVAFSCVPYEKGSAFLFYLEQLLGGPEIFEAYLRNYLTTFAHQAIDSYQWKDHLFEYFKDKKELLDTVDFDLWFNGVGMPPKKPVYDETMVKACDALYRQWIEATEDNINDIQADEYMKMQPLQQIEFLAQLWQHEPSLPHWKIEALSKLYKLEESENCEILLKFIRLSIKAKWEPIVDLALDFVDRQGRLKYCRPVYKDLAAWPASAAKARKLFLTTRHSMHPITAEMIAKDLHLRHSIHTVCF